MFKDYLQIALFSLIILCAGIIVHEQSNARQLRSQLQQYKFYVDDMKDRYPDWYLAAYCKCADKDTPKEWRKECLQTEVALHVK